MKIICHLRDHLETLIWFGCTKTGATCKVWVANEESHSLIVLSLPAIAVADEDSGDSLAKQFHETKSILKK